MASALTACSTVGTNQPIADGAPSPGNAHFSTEGGYYLSELEEDGASEELFLILAISGGGKRSSAFSYGVLRGLREMPIVIDGRRTRLLDEVDAISSVSGGSFTAAYYGLHRDRTFTDYETDFLRQNMRGEIASMYFLPWNWQWMVDLSYGTNDHMAKVYDRLMFHGATYEQLKRNGRPLINIVATDVTFGTAFPFNQNNFDLICSNLLEYPLARAVAASNGFPVLFTPITLTNHASQCAGRQPAWVAEDEAIIDPLSRQKQLALSAEKYLDQTRTPYIHLMDGGISDNLAIRGALQMLETHGLGPRDIEESGLSGTRRFVMLFADGQSAADETWAKERTVTGLSQIFAAVSGTQIDLYNFETLVLARRALQKMVKSAKLARCQRARTISGHACDDVKGYFIHLSLSQIPDADVRASLQSIPTGLTLDDKDIDLLIQSGIDLTKSSAQLQDLVGEF